MPTHPTRFLLALSCLLIAGCSPDPAETPTVGAPEVEAPVAAAPAMRVALYVGNEMYPGSSPGPAATIQALQASPLTSPILGLVNHSAQDPSLLVYNDASNPLFSTAGDYLGSADWAATLADLRSGGDIAELYLSFSTNGTQYLSDLLASDSTAAIAILTAIKDSLGFDGIDLDDESGNYVPGSPLYTVADAATAVGLKLTAAPYYGKAEWQAWVDHVQAGGGEVAWLNLQCYAGGKSLNPGDWLDIGVPIVGGSCSDCANPQTTCSPQDMEALFTLWRTGEGTVPSACWTGTPNTAPQAIGGGFIWVYSSIAGPEFSDYMNAMATGLGVAP